MAHIIQLKGNATIMCANDLQSREAMLRALKVDGEKLRQLTGQDHGPREMCDTCGEPVPWQCIIFTAEGVETFRCDDCRTKKE